MKQQEIRRNKEKETRQMRKKKPKRNKNRHDSVAVFVGHFDYKTGDFLRFWPFLCPPIEVTAIYIYIYHGNFSVFPSIHLSIYISGFTVKTKRPFQEKLTYFEAASAQECDAWMAALTAGGTPGVLHDCNLSFPCFSFCGLPCLFSFRGFPCFFVRFSLLCQGFGRG